MTHKTQNIYSLAFYRKSLPTSALDESLEAGSQNVNQLCKAIIGDFTFSFSYVSIVSNVSEMKTLLFSIRKKNHRCFFFF